MASSHHRPVLLAINFQFRPSHLNTFARRKYAKADWEAFSCLSNKYYKTDKADQFIINKATDSFSQSIVRPVPQKIPRGARKNYRLHRTQELQGLEDKVARIRQMAENDPTPKDPTTAYTEKNTARPTYKLQEQAGVKNRTP